MSHSDTTQEILSIVHKVFIQGAPSFSESSISTLSLECESITRRTEFSAMALSVRSPSFVSVLTEKKQMSALKERRKSSA